MDDIVGKIFFSVASIFVIIFLPLMAIFMKADNTSQALVEQAVVEFVDNARANGRITDTAYEELCRKLDIAQTGMELYIVHSSKYMDKDQNGEPTVYFYDYHKQEILDVIYTPTGENESYRMKNGDYLEVKVYNTKPTMATKLYRLIMPNYNPNNVVLYYNYGREVGNGEQ